MEPENIHSFRKSRVVECELSLKPVHGTGVTMMNEINRFFCIARAHHPVGETEELNK